MLNNEISISNEMEMLAAVVAVLFTPKETGDDYIKYDKESIYQLAATLDHVFETWYNVSLETTVKEANDSSKDS